MAASLLAMLSQQTPNLPVRKGLILTGLQHDFVSSDGKLPVSNLDSGFLDRTKSLIDKFRGHGDIIWVCTEIDASRDPGDFDEDYCSVITSLIQHDPSDSEDDSEEDPSESETEQVSRKRKPESSKGSRTDTQGASRNKQPRASHSDNVASTSNPLAIEEEHFLTRTANRGACFIKGTAGADFAADIKSSVQPTDLQVTKGCYSAFCSTSLLQVLRSKLITELYVCGAMTNLNVYATSADAARYGIKITLVEDCLGYRDRERHDLAIKRLVDIMEADVATSDQVVAKVTGRPPTQSKQHIPLGSHPDEANETPGNMLEVASSDEEEEDDDLLSVRVSPYKSHRPLEIRGSRPQGKDLQALDTGPEPHSQLQRHAPAKPVASHSTGQRKTEDILKRPREVKTVKLENTSSPSQPSVVSERPGTNIDKQTGGGTTQHGSSSRVVNTSRQPTKISLETPGTEQQGTIRKPNTTRKPRRRVRKSDAGTIVERHAEQPLFGVGKEEESCQSSIQYDLLPPDRLDGLFDKLKEEVTWQRMHHQTGEVPRLVCCQGTIDSDGSMPVYRHPSDETIALLPWTPAVDEIRQAAEATVGHVLNHALIQLYRAGTDYISEHSDKTLDIVPGTSIVNASFGAERVMRLRTKRGATPVANTTPSSTPNQDPQSRTTHRVRLPHNSALLMSLPTNAQYLHSISPDKRLASELTPAEKAYDGQRISLTFRQIGTFLDAESEHIWGQGAVGKEKRDARKVVYGNVAEAEKLVKGFGAENAAAEVRWEEWYGTGSDVLHLK